MQIVRERDAHGASVTNGADTLGTNANVVHGWEAQAGASGRKRAREGGAYGRPDRSSFFPCPWHRQPNCPPVRTMCIRFTTPRADREAAADELVRLRLVRRAVEPDRLATPTGVRCNKLRFMATPPPLALSVEPAALIARPVSIIVGTCNAVHRPHVMRAAAARLSKDRSQLTLLMPTSSGAQVLADLRDNGGIAVVFSEPTTHRTLQVKGRSACILDCTPDDLAFAAAHRARFAEEIGELGFGAEIADAILGRGEALVAVCFTIAEAFDQTPGPAAGERLAPERR